MPISTVRSTAYERYLHSKEPDFLRFAATYQRIVGSRLKIFPAWRCLDIACGKGNFLAFLRANCVIDYVGVDITEAAIVSAAREFGGEHAVLGDALTYLEARQGAYDFVSAIDFVEHISKEELSTFLERVSAALAPNGYLLIRTPNPSAPFGMAARYNDVTHETCFTHTALTDYASRFGFRFVRVWEDIGIPRSLLQFLHYLIWRLIDFFYKILDVIENGALVWTPMTRNYWLLLRKDIK